MKTITPIREKWRGTMTERERFNAQMHYKPFDRTFNMEFGYWDENFTEWKLFTQNGVANNDEADRLFAFDRIETIGSNVWLDPPFAPVEMSRTERTKTVLNGDGLWTEVALDGHSSIPHCVKSSVETPDDWKRVKEERFQLNSPGRKINIEAIKTRYPKDRDFPVGVNAGSMIGKIRDMLTFEGLCYAQYDYPEMLEDMVETCCVQVEHELDQLLPVVDFDYAAGWEDICFKNGPIVAPDFFRDVVMPRYKRINAKLKAHGIDLWYCDCDGDIRPILDSFLEGGINCMFPYEVNSCLHPKELLDIYGKQLRIMGGIDKMQMKAGKDAIKAYLKSVEPLVVRGGYIPFCDHRCPPDVAEDDYIYYLDLKEKMFGL
ncbi:hypothetical protein FACS1894184_02650 [Clostridia bacterium]|nr:hypothetical protein FACS1894184_02650 [Clostridia bacterium]